MRSMTLGCVCVAAALIVMTPAATAQDVSPAVVAKWHLVITKPGESLQFENSYREHLKVSAANHDPWAWNTWQIVNGENLGQYVILTSNHTWEDLDRHSQASRLRMADLFANVFPHVQSISSTLEAVEPSLSNWNESSARPELVEITVFKLKYDRTLEFFEALSKMHKAVTAKDPTRQYAWFSSVNGSDGPTMKLAIPHRNWAGFYREGPSVWELLEQVYGEQGAAEIRETIGASIRQEQSYVLQHREDLSYSPEEE